MRTYLIILSAAILFVVCSCSKDSYESYSGTDGVGGSMACFTVMGNYLYTVDLNSIYVYDISTPAQPVKIASKYLGLNVETLFNNGKNLFVGSSNGFYIISVTNPANPVVLANYQHVQSCDPVIADTMNAWVTLNTNQSFCGNTVNELQVVSIANPSSPSLLKRYTMTGPMGLSKNDTALFVCDNGIKMYDCRNPQNIILKYSQYISAAYDVIVNDSLVMIIGPQGMSQFRINGWHLDLVSNIPVNP